MGDDAHEGMDQIMKRLVSISCKAQSRADNLHLITDHEMHVVYR